MLLPGPVKACFRLRVPSHGAFILAARLTLGLLLAPACCRAFSAQRSASGGDLGIVGDPLPGPSSLAGQPVGVQIIFQLTNQDRALQGLAALRWDPKLAAAAAAHVHRMAAAASSELSHRYPGEPDLASRAGQAGAHFSRIAENIAQGGSAPGIEKQWMTSVPHRANILDPAMTAIGVATFAAGGALYAAEDFAEARETLSPAAIEHQVETEIAGVARQGSKILDRIAPVEARQECTHTEGLALGSAAKFILRWEGSDLQLPQALVNAVTSGRYTSVAVGSCAPVEGANRSFTVYRVAVLLY